MAEEDGGQGRGTQYLLSVVTSCPLLGVSVASGLSLPGIKFAVDSLLIQAS